MKKEETQKRTITGVVFKTSMNKTINVKVDRKKKHPKYQKFFRITRKFHVHDEKEVAKVGDTVRFVECRPLSKTKRWRLIEIVK